MVRMSDFDDCGSGTRLRIGQEADALASGGSVCSFWVRTMRTSRMRFPVIRLTSMRHPSLCTIAPTSGIAPSSSITNPAIDSTSRSSLRRSISSSASSNARLACPSTRKSAAESA